jgi:outer membrane protein OmpA-like peptidoglycan-associated protein
MRTRKQYTDGDTSNFDLSISDLMSALCGIFALIMICVVVLLNTTKAEYNSKNKKAEEYYSKQKELYDDLNEEFKNDLKKWNAEITPDLTIRFKDSNVLFEPWKADLRPEFKNILHDFFPRLIIILEKPQYKAEIDEIRIEGHTARERKKSFNQDYKEGMELSQERTREVMLYCLNGLKNKDREWVQSNIAAIGYSLSRPVKVADEINWEVSRRVEFKIKTKAEKVIEELADKEFKIAHE